MRHTLPRCDSRRRRRLTLEALEPRLLLSSAPVGPLSILREPLPPSAYVGPPAVDMPAPVADGTDLRDGLRITELMFDPSGGPDYEFVELSNIGATPLDLTGARLAGGIDFTFPATTLGAGEYIVVVDDVEDFQSRYGSAVEVAGAFTGNLSDAGELLSLLAPSPDDVPILAFVYDGAWYPEAGNGASLVVVDAATDPALWGFASAWRPSTEYGGSPGADDGAFAPGPIVINELHTNPDVKTEQVEFVELHNPTGEDVDVSGWYFSNGLDYTLPADTTILSGGYLVIGENPADIQAKFGITAFGPFVGSLHNEGETVTLRDASGAIVDRVDYGLAFPWPTVGDAGGRAMELVDPSFDNDLGGHWRSGGPTPGAANSVLAANLPPTIRQVDHSPNTPSSGEAVAITAKITDVDGVAAVTLEYQLVQPGGYIHLTDPEYAANWTPVPMADDGLGGDDAASDFVYTAVLPGAIQTHRLLVRYRITIEDSTGLSVTVPYADDTQPNFAYFVYDAVPNWSGAIDPDSSDPARAEVAVYDDAVMNSLPIYQLISSKDTVEHSTWIDRYGGSDYPYGGTLYYDGVVYDHISFRARGGVWRYAMGKNMWKFDFNRGHYFQARDDYGKKYDTTWDKLNFSACIQQGDYQHRGEQGMFEAVGFKMFNLAGIEGPKTHWLQFRIVDEAAETGPTQYDGDFWGLYLAIEQMDGQFLDEHLLPDGNLYKMESGTGTLNNQGPTAADDRSDLNLYLNTYNNTTPTVEWWQSNMDLDRYYAYRVVVEGIHHGDIAGGKNYFYYLDPDTGRWSTHPWDLDLTWADNMYGNGNEPFKSRVLPIPEFNRAYQNAMRSFMDLLYNTDQGYQLIDDYAWIINDPAGGPSIVDADRAMWDYNPIMTSSYVNLSKAGEGRFYG
ncbi:lamin tail domain-containing protein, partial [bacterium]|nr:lamin tail domain-containing protein [bacterium]